MRESGFAKISLDGDGQTVRLPEKFRLPGTEVRVSYQGAAVLLEPLPKKMTEVEIDAIFADLEKYHDITRHLESPRVLALSGPSRRRLDAALTPVLTHAAGAGANP